MKKSVVWLMSALLVFGFNLAIAQSNVSKPKAFNIAKEVKPPILKVVQNTIKFNDPNNNGVIDADEKCSITFTIKNDGVGEAVGCMAEVTAAGATAGITLAKVQLSKIKVGEQRTITCPVYANMNTETGDVNFSVAVTEPMGFGTNPFKMSVGTRAFVSPFLQVVDYTITGSPSGVLQKKMPFDLQVLLQNTRQGLAEDVKVEVKLPDGVFPLGGDINSGFASVKGGEAKSMVYSLVVNDNYKQDIVPITISLKEKHGKYAENRTINLQLNQTMSAKQVVINSVGQEEAGTISIAALQSDVDKDIPVASVKNEKIFAVIIANESYKRVAPVEFALNDGRIFKQYCMKTLGIPASNIHHLENASLNEMRGEINWLKKVLASYNGEAKVIFYYAGHGIPDESNHTAYLLPVDGYETDVESGYKLGDLYSVLGGMPSKYVTIFIDACFGGSKREGDMIASARGASIKVREEEPVGKTIVFTASQGDETAYSFKEQQHGMFTYFLLKKLKETKGSATMGELINYVRTNVSQKSIVLNGKSQTPSVIPSLTMGDQWKSLTLK